MNRVMLAFVGKSLLHPGPRRVIPARSSRHLLRFSPRHVIIRQNFTLARSFSTGVMDDDDDCEDEEDSDSDDRPKNLADLQFKDYDMGYVRNMVDDGKIQLQPFYQRGFKWTPKQSSAWIESILLGYPCMPHIIFISTTGEDGKAKYAVFDGQQRLTSTMHFISGSRGDTWRKLKSGDNDFRLEGLPKLKAFEDLRYQDLPQMEQNKIREYPLKCAIIPESWPMESYIDFFKRYQGGGTPMTDHELRRALSQGPFTELLDELATDDVVVRSLDGCTPQLKRDDIAQLILRYFQYLNSNSPHGAKFGKPTLAQNGLETMKHFNKDMNGWTGEEMYRREKLMIPLRKSLELTLYIFNKDEAFRRPYPLIKGEQVVDKDELKKAWINQSKMRDPIWDCTVAAFAHDDVLAEESAIRLYKGEIRERLISVMQTDPLFTATLRSADISPRIQLFVSEILSVVKKSGSPSGSPNKRVAIPFQQRKELIKSAKDGGVLCKLCEQSMEHSFDEHLHIDHIAPVSKGGSNEGKNLQVVHKICNLMKSNKSSLKPRATREHR